MREIVEFRIPEEDASRFLAAHEGKSLGGIVRVLRVATNDPLYVRIGQLDSMLRQREGKPFFLGWMPRRYYTSQELNSAALFRLRITAAFEPAGEECGTVYDSSTACPDCGAGRRQVSDLVLDLRKIPTNKDIARTIADEWIVNQRLAQLLVDHQVTGFQLRPVRHKAYDLNDLIDLTKLESGRELLQRAEIDGHPYPEWSFWVWLNRPEQSELLHQTRREHISSQEQARTRLDDSLPVWYQLVITSKPISLSAPTRFGVHPFDEDREARYRCPREHVSGLNVLSELWVSDFSWDRSDIARTENLIGTRRGLLVPAPLLLISPSLYKLLRARRIKGYEVEIAHLL